MEVEIMQMLGNVIDRWCPETCKNESFELKMVRALLELNAYMLDYDRIQKGEDTIRETYPIQLPSYRR